MKTKTFTLEVDEERHLVMKMFNGIATSEDFGPVVAQVLKEAGLANAAVSLLEEFGDKAHEMGWCHDPKCTHGKEGST